VKNRNDYDAGFTKPILGPDNKLLYGGAARNYRLGMMGGVTGVQAQALAAFAEQIAPVFAQQQEQIVQLQRGLLQLTELMQRSGGTLNVPVA